MKKAGTYQIPFTARKVGVTPSMLEYVGYGASVEWRDNTTFEATVNLVGHHRGRSAARVTVTNIANGERYSMGLAGFFDAIKAFGSRRGQITGRWTFVKQGSNYALAPVTEGP